MKTWFIAGRTKEPEISSGKHASNPSDSDSIADSGKNSFKKATLN
jgi:hypothetical protein